MMQRSKLELGLDIAHVPYKRSAPAVRDVNAGYVQIQCASLNAAGQSVPQRSRFDRLRTPTLEKEAP